MLVNLVGLDIVNYSKDGAEKSFAKIFCIESADSGKITSGRRVFEVITSEKYSSRLYESASAGKPIHIGWGKDHKAFLYTK